MEQLNFPRLIDTRYEWRYLLGNQFQHCGHRSGENRGDCVAFKITASQNECSDTCIDQRLSFEETTLDPFVFCYDYPLAFANEREPLNIFGSPTKVTIVLFN
jgi:hypothetical protein